MLTWFSWQLHCREFNVFFVTHSWVKLSTFFLHNHILKRLYYVFLVVLFFSCWFWKQNLILFFVCSAYVVATFALFVIRVEKMLSSCCIIFCDINCHRFPVFGFVIVPEERSMTSRLGRGRTFTPQMRKRAWVEHPFRANHSETLIQLF